MMPDAPSNDGIWTWAVLPTGTVTVWAYVDALHVAETARAFTVP